MSDVSIHLDPRGYPSQVVVMQNRDLIVGEVIGPGVFDDLHYRDAAGISESLGEIPAFRTVVASRSKPHPYSRWYLVRAGASQLS